MGSTFPSCQPGSSVLLPPLLWFLLRGSRALSASASWEVEGAGSRTLGIVRDGPCELSKQAAPEGTAGGPGSLAWGRRRVSRRLRSCPSAQPDLSLDG